MSRTIKLCLTLAAITILLPIASGARPVIRNILPTGVAPNPQDRIIMVKAVTNTAIGIWINGKQQCRDLSGPPNFGGISDGSGNYSSPLTSLTAYNQGVTNGDLVCVGPRYFGQSGTQGPIARCNCARVK